MKKIFSLFVVLLVCFSIGLADSGKKYTSNHIDLSLDHVAPDYLGNDPKYIYSSIDDREKSSLKGEFETTEQYQKRISISNNNQNAKGIFSFQGYKPKMKYSADDSEFTILIRVGAVLSPFEHSLIPPQKGKYDVSDFKKDDKSITLIVDMEDGGSYEAENVYGAKTIVEKTVFTSYDVAVTYCNDFPIETIEDEQFPIIKFDYIVGKFPSPPEEARKIKKNIGCLVIGKLEKPFIHETFILEPATFDSPYDVSRFHRYLHMRMLELWIYNQETGKVYVKLKNT